MYARTRVGLLTAVAVATLVGLPLQALAQLGGGRMSGSGGGKKPPTRPQTPPPVQKKDTSTGTGLLLIAKYSPAKNAGTDSEFAGTLMGKIETIGQLSIEIPSNLNVMIAPKQFSPEELEGLLIPGLYVKVGWETTKIKNRTVKKARELTLATIDVGGVREKGEETSKKDKEAVAFKIYPTGGLWPDDEGKKTPTGVGPDGKAKERKVFCKIIEGVSKLKDEEGQTLATLFDVTPEKKLRAKIVYGRNVAYVIELSVGDAPDPSKTNTGGGNNRDKPPVGPRGIGHGGAGG